LLRPELSVRVQPLVQLAQVIRTQRIDSLLCVYAYLDEACLSQDLEVARNGRLG